MPPAVGSFGGGSSSSTRTVKRSPDELAARSYNAGLKNRDKGNGYAAKALAATKDRDVTKYEKRTIKEFNRAIKKFKKAIKYRPGMYQAHSSLGYAYRKVGRFDESLGAYDRALQLVPDYGEAIEYRGEAYLGLNRLDDAKAAYMHLFQMDRDLAGQLMQAMDAWVGERRADPQGLDAGVVDGFSKWVNERRELSSYLPGGSEITATW